MSILRFSKISIVESLGNDDRKTGQLLAHDLRMLEIFHEKGIVIECKLISKTEELISHIQTLIDDAQDFGIYPILQIEAHGCEDKQGIVLSSGDFISWGNLEDILRELNIATKCNLLVVMATCFGMYATHIISLLDRAPFWGVVGPFNKVSGEIILSSLTNFYTGIYTGRDAIELLASSEAELKLLTSEGFFVAAYKYYIKTMCNDSVLTSRIKQLKEKLYILGLRSFPSDEFIKWALKPDGKNEFDAYIRHFFMLDLYPENADKISVRFEQLNLIE